MRTRHMQSSETKEDAFQGKSLLKPFDLRIESIGFYPGKTHIASGPIRPLRLIDVADVATQSAVTAAAMHPSAYHEVQEKGAPRTEHCEARDHIQDRKELRPPLDDT